MDIGSAKITKEEMDGIPHHLIDVLEPEEALQRGGIPGAGESGHGRDLGDGAICPS